MNITTHREEKAGAFLAGSDAANSSDDEGDTAKYQQNDGGCTYVRVAEEIKVITESDVYIDASGDQTETKKLKK